jgi:hypothetical protein
LQRRWLANEQPTVALIVGVVEERLDEVHQRMKAIDVAC